MSNRETHMSYRETQTSNRETHGDKDQGDPHACATGIRDPNKLQGGPHELQGDLAQIRIRNRIRKTQMINRGATGRPR